MGGLLSHMPWLRYIMPKLSGYNDLMHALDQLWGFIGSEIDEHEANLVDGEDRQPRDLIEAFLMEIRDRDSKTFHEHEVDIFDRKTFALFFIILKKACILFDYKRKESVYCLGLRNFWQK